MTDIYTPSTRNVTRLFRQATDAQVAAGMSWYADAHRIADALAVKYDVSIETSSGILAVLSPMQSWGANVNLAARFLDAGGLTEGYLKSNLAKGRAILAGAAPLDILGGDKVRAFYAGIVSNGQTDIVCVDRHSHDIAAGVRLNDATRPKLSGKRYAAFAEVHTRAARILSRETGQALYAAQVQAVTWVAHRARYWAEGAFDGHTVQL